MLTSLIQYCKADGARAVAVLDGAEAPRELAGIASVIDLARQAVHANRPLADVALEAAGEMVDLDRIQLLPPVDLSDPSHVLLTGTGLTHLGSAEGRDRMHRKAAENPDPTDSMKMFLMGVEGGKPASGETGVQPEWFYKGDGSSLVASGAPLVSPAFAQDAGEEPEIAGIYLIDEDGNPIRLGFALANEFSDHVTERGNYLWLAHSKLRQAAVGPELLLGPLPDHVAGTSRIWRDGQCIWERPFLSGEANMSHSIENLERHHFKYGQFRRPGQVHVHFFGTATLSFSDEIRTQDGDRFEISAQPFRLPLSNELRTAEDQPVQVRQI